MEQKQVKVHLEEGQASALRDQVRGWTFDFGSCMLTGFWGCITSCLILPSGWAVRMLSGVPALGQGHMRSVFTGVVCMLT